MIRTILVPLDGSPESERILPEAARLSPSAVIHLLHVTPNLAPPMDRPMSFLDLPEEIAQYLASVRAKWRKTQGAEIVRSGEVIRETLSVARDQNVDLIAMATHARFGSLGESLVRRTERPVLLKRIGLPPAESPLKRILVPVDGSARSDFILKIVKPIAAPLKAEIVLLHVTPLVRDPAPYWAMKGPISTVERHSEKYSRMADRLEENGVSARSIAAEGDTVPEILAKARELEVDLVAMSTHGWAGLTRALGGSVAHEVLRHCDRPLLMVRSIGKGIRDE